MSLAFLSLLISSIKETLELITVCSSATENVLEEVSICIIIVTTRNYASDLCMIFLPFYYILYSERS